jgi:leucine-rich repeat protein SHOC2
MTCRSMAPYANLQEFDVSNNQLKELPHGLCDMKNGLSRLAADHNELKTVPEYITCLGNLQILSLQSNQINSLPALAGLDSLQQLDLSNNKLEVLPESLVLLPSLKRLDLRFNVLVSSLIPEATHESEL